MVFKLNISENGKAWKLELDSEFLIGKSIGDTIEGKEIKPELSGYDLEIRGASDLAGFPHSKNIEGLGLKKSLLTKGWGMHDSREGVRIRKTLRGKVISASTTQINLAVLKAGAKSLAEVFPDQNQKKEAKSEAKPVEALAA